MPRSLVALVRRNQQARSRAASTKSAVRVSVVARHWAVNALLADLDPSQRLLLSTIDGARRRFGSWPIWQYVDSMLYQDADIDATSILLTLPSIRASIGLGRYGLVWVNAPLHTSVAAGEVIGLTVTGLSQIDAQYEVELFMETLQYLVECERFCDPSPTEVQDVVVTSAEIGSALQLRTPHRAPLRLSDGGLAQLAAMLDHEPIASGIQIDSGAANRESWSVRLSSHIRRFRDVDSIEDYANRVEELLAPPVAPSTKYPSSLALPEAIDYLNVVWRAHAGAPLLTIRRADAASKLVLDCASADEFDARISAICGILDGLHLPTQPAPAKLTDLDTYLTSELPVDSAARTREAVADLRSLFALRAWRQHPGADERLRNAKIRLGLQLPTNDWGDAWTVVQARAINALNALREEIEDHT